MNSICTETVYVLNSECAFSYKFLDFRELIQVLYFLKLGFVEFFKFFQTRGTKNERKLYILKAVNPRSEEDCSCEPAHASKQVDDARPCEIVEAT